jgi:AraC-like DNA-binding protein
MSEPNDQWRQCSYGLAGERFTMERPWGNHTHPDLELNLVLSGTVTYIHAGHERQVEAGRLVAFWAGLPHGVQATEGPVDFCWLTVPLDALLVWGIPTQGLSELLAGGVITDDRDPELDRRQFPGWITELEAGDEARAVARLEIQARVRRLLGSGAARPSGSANLVLRLIDWLGDHFTEDIRIADAAEAVDCHPQQAMRQFKEATGLTIGAWLTAMRLGMAARMLQTTRLPVSDVAARSGFGSRSRFYAAFQSAYGHSPVAWREANAN